MQHEIVPCDLVKYFIQNFEKGGFVCILLKFFKSLPKKCKVSNLIYLQALTQTETADVFQFSSSVSDRKSAESKDL
jgi:hypothetical protein